MGSNRTKQMKIAILISGDFAQNDRFGPNRIAVKDFGASVPGICTESRGASFGTSPGPPKNNKNHKIGQKLPSFRVSGLMSPR